MLRGIYVVVVAVAYDVNSFCETVYGSSGKMRCVMRKPTFWFPTWSDTNQAVQLQKMARGLKFQIKKVERFTFYEAKTKELISFAGTAKLNCVFVFAYAKG